MYTHLNEGCVVNYGWQHYWRDSEKFTNLFAKEIVKGPFTKPKTTCLLPFVSYMKKGSFPFECNKGISYWQKSNVIHDLNSTKEPYVIYDSMSIENVDPANSLGKNYRVYLGQGIPDPWMTYPFIDNGESLNQEFKKYIEKYIHELHNDKANKNFSKDPCLCCHKNYLFKCPDEFDTNLKKQNVNCSCEDCHLKNSDTISKNKKNCRCSQILQNSTCENTDMCKRLDKNDKSKKNLPSSNQTNDETNTASLKKEGEQVLFCTCLPNQTPSFLGKNKWDQNLCKGFSTSDSDMCFCSFIKNFVKTDPSKLSEKYTQTENILFHQNNGIKISKKIQIGPPFSQEPSIERNAYKTANSKHRHQCQCSVTTEKCRTLDNKLNLPFTSMYQIPQNLYHYPHFFYPYYHQNNFMIHQLHRVDCPKLKELHKKIQEKNNENVEELTSDFSGRSSVKPQIKYSQKKDKQKQQFERGDWKTNEPSFSKSSERTLCYEPSTLSYNQLKYLTDMKLKNYLKKKENSPLSYKSEFLHCPESSKMSGTLKKWYDSQQDSSGVELERVKSFYCRSLIAPEDKFRSSEEQKIIIPTKKEFLMKRFNSAIQTTTPIEHKEEKSIHDIPMKIKFIKEILESDESRTYGLRNNKESGRAVRKRRRLLANKRRKKLERKKCSLSKKNLPDYVNMKIQNDCDAAQVKIPSSKKVSFGFTACTENSAPNLMTTENRFSLRSPQPSTFKHSEYFSSCRDRDPDFSRKQSKLNSLIEKLSFNSGTTWSSNTLKNVVNDLLIDKQCLESLKQKF